VPRPLAAAIALLACAAAFLSAAAAAASWRAPVPGGVLRPFAYSPRAPFTRGARRGADFRAHAGERVVAPCGGRISFAGRVPRFGPALSIRCGALVATLLGVRPTRRGAVRRGAQVGRAPLALPPVRAPKRARPAPAMPALPALPWTAWAGLGLLGSLLGPWIISTSRRRSTTSTLRRILATRTR